ncbi:dihydrolipoyl dehydrogenase [Mycoplasmopsis phocirhinis]|uniref:Dihydrolipoyl dehydrogenase n=1 Tax=Mycoplasmopsis phocirhinis TaxID=142650 RepID=A0A4P6MNX2_9BACT|nr:dihydrolipoyl dehydrogenase [Mycoplasmopsis phocirhinis]QBF34396.1 dihydrolipoyl dehydrogenase [Mycoplasmopsis phocirhinis]
MKKAFSEKGVMYTGNVDAEYDVIVVGAGPGGYLAAEELGKSGKKVLIVEKEFWGGVCLNVGCIPTKAMLASVHVLDVLKNAASYGVVANLEDLKVNKQETWKKMHERKAAVVKQISGGVKMLMKGSKVAIEEGCAEWLSSHVIKVNDKVYRGQNIIMAMGSRARKLDQLSGFEQGYKDFTVLSSREAINFDQKLPESVTIVGGGVIGVEFAQVFATAGSKVTIIQNTDSLLTGMDKDLIKEITKHFKSSGIEIIYNASTTGLNENKELTYEVNGEQKTILSDVYLIAVGRVPNSHGLEKTGVELGQRQEVLVDEYMRTNVENVYAIGDLTAQNMLAHVAYQHALSAVAHILGHDVKYELNKPVPGCIYTHPEISVIGLTEERAKELGMDVFSSKYSFGYLGKAIATKDTSGFAKLVVDRSNGLIVGAAIIGANSTDYIAEIGMAMQHKLSVSDITYTTHPHPTFNEIVWEAARAAHLKLELEKAKH